MNVNIYSRMIRTEQRERENKQAYGKREERHRDRAGKKGRSRITAFKAADTMFNAAYGLFALAYTLRPSRRDEKKRKTKTAGGAAQANIRKEK